MSASVFAQTKFQPPRVRDQHVVRARLLEQTKGMLAGHHLLVTAPAGAGKSTFAAQWARDTPHTAWVSLGEEDDEPGRFWSAVIGGLGTVVPGIGESELGALVAGGDVNAVLLRLLVEIGRSDLDIALMIDDLHLIEDRECLDGVSLVLNHAPPNLRLALCSRTTPQLDLNRLIAHGIVMVVEGHDLLLDQSEVEEFLCARLGFELEPGAVRSIFERTEGWAAGVYMAALAMRLGQQPVAVPVGGDRRTRGYLTAEVLEEADPDRLAFLEGVSVLERFCARLCDHALGRTDSAEMIESLEQSNLFMIALDESGTWYRLHHLFAELLRERLEARGGARAIYARAAEWHLEQDDYPAAIMARIKAEEFEVAGELIATHHVISINRSRLGAEVARWLDLLPPAVVRGTPALCLSRAWIAGAAGRLGEWEEWMERAGDTPHEGPLPDGSASVEAQIELMRGCFAFADHGAVLRHTRRAAELDRPESAWWALIQFVSGFAEWLGDGDREVALASLQRASEAVKGPQDALSAAVSPAIQAAIQAELGNTASARAALVRAEAVRRQFPALEHVQHAAVSWWTTARARLLLGDIEGAERDAEFACAHTADIAPDRDSTMLVPPSLIALAHVRMAQGRREEARPLLLDAQNRLKLSKAPGRYTQWVTESLAELSPTVADVSGVPGVDELSERELEVLARFVGPLSLPEIGEELFVSQNTVKSHARSIYRKLNVGGRAEAVERGRELGLL